MEVDRSKRVLHGALIDCELLAEVYLAMTRSQFSLVDELTSPLMQSQTQTIATKYQIDHEQLRVIAADENELAEHEAYLLSLDKIVDGDCLWRKWDKSV